MMEKDDVLKLISRFNDSHNVKENRENIHFTYAMGTLISQKIGQSIPKAQEVISEGLKLIHWLEKMMSFHDVHSQLNQINQQSGQSWVSIDDELFFIIKESKRYARLTDGLFDITIASLVELWQYYGKLKRVPSQFSIRDTLKKVDYEDILIDEESKEITLRQLGQRIDLGGIAKGYISNQVIQFYRQKGLQWGMINLGGNVALLGKRPDGESWLVGIQDPDQERNQCLATVGVNDTTVVTSGDYERLFLDHNLRYHHILNPYTGYPADSGLRSVTIIHPDGMLADVLSTTIFILGLEKGIELLQRFSDVKIVMVDQDKRIFISRNLVKQFQLIESGYSLFQI